MVQIPNSLKRLVTYSTSALMISAIACAAAFFVSVEPSYAQNKGLGKQKKVEKVLKKSQAVLSSKKQAKSVLVQKKQAKAVPEPFTVVSTLMGGTAVWQMRKKFNSSAKTSANESV